MPWPSVSLTPVDLTSHLVKRMNEASVGNMHAYNNIMHLSQLYNKCCGTVPRLLGHAKLHYNFYCSLHAHQGFTICIRACHMTRTKSPLLTLARTDKVFKKSIVAHCKNYTSSCSHDFNK